MKSMNRDYLNPKGQLPHPCHKCKKSFKTKKDYRVHLTTSLLHNGFSVDSK